MALEHLTEVGAVVDKLGGSTATAYLTGRRVQHVSNWRAAKRFPPDTFLIMRAELAKRGCTAPPSLWSIREPDDDPVAAPCQEGAR